jgi:hypothetical protein
MYLQMLPGTFVEKVFYFDEKENFVVGAFLTVTMFNIGCTIKWLAAIWVVKKLTTLCSRLIRHVLSRHQPPGFYILHSRLQFFEDFFPKKEPLGSPVQRLQYVQAILNNQLFGLTHSLEVKIES